MTTVSRLGGLLLLSGSLALSAGCSSKAERIQSRLQKAGDFAKAESWDKAGVEVRNVLQMDPKNAPAYLLAGRVEEGRHELQRAFNAYSKAVELRPGYAEAQVGMARIEMLGGEGEAARQLIDQVLAAQPGHAGARTVRAALLAQQGKAAEAIAEAQAVLAGPQPPEDAVLVLAGVHASQGDVAKALQVVDQALARDRKNSRLLQVAAALADEQKNDPASAQRAVGYYKAAAEQAPQNATLWNGWALHHARRNELDAAEQVLRASLKAEPDDSQRALTLVDFLATRRSAAVAEAEFKTLIAAHPKDTALRFGLAAFYKGRDRTADAESQLQQIVELGKDQPAGLRARTELAAIRIAQNRLDDARNQLDEVLKANSRDGQALVLRGRLLLAEGKAADAILDLRAAAKDQPGSLDIATALAQAHRAAGEPQLAREVLATVVKFKPEEPEPHLVLAEDMASTGDIKSALAEVDDALKQAPAHVRAHELKARYQVALKDWAGAEKTLQALKQQPATAAIGALRLGQLYAEQKKTDAALKEYDASLALAPDAPEPLFAAISLLVSQRKFDAAQARVEALMKAKPGQPLPYQLAGDVAMARPDAAAAAKAYERMVELAPSIGLGYRNLARAKAMLGDTPAALAVLAKGTQANPNDLTLATERAEWLARAQRDDEAIAAYEALLQRAPDDLGLANNLAYLLSEKKGDKASLEKALQISSRFEGSNNAGFLDTLGWVHYKLGQYPKAVPLLDRAVSLAPKSPVFQLHLGLALYKNGDTQRGRPLLRKAVDGKGVSPDIDEARRLVAMG